MEVLIQQLFNGLTIGSVYSLIALGLTLVYGILHIPNFAHGAVYMIGGYVTLTMMIYLGFNYWIAIAVSVIAVGALSVLMERFVFHPLRNTISINSMIAAIGMLIFLVTFFGIYFTVQIILIIISTIAVMALLYIFLKKTFIGRSIVAMSQNREGAFLVGINANKVAMLTFLVAGALAAIAASLTSPINLVFPDMGHLVILKAFVIIIIGGMGSIPGAILGGYILGFSE